MAADGKTMRWREAGLRYNSYSRFLRSFFGQRVQKVSIDAGFTCPNVDGTVTTGGCTFCENRSFSPSRRIPRQQIIGQINEGISRLKRRYKCDQFTAYFQPATNTYAPVDRLRYVYDAALSHSKIVAMAIGTRPDCVPDDVIDLLSEVAEQTYLSVELGLQTIHDKSMDWMNRGHYFGEFVDAMDRCHGRGFEICVHIIIGLPGESREDIMETARAVAQFPIDSVKLHNLYVVKNTVLADQYTAGEVEMMGRDEYVRTLVDFLELLPPRILVERISGDAPGDYFLGPSWCRDKPDVLKAVENEFEKRDTWQGRLCEPARVCGT